MSGICINCLSAGCRVWTEIGLREHGHKKVNVPAKTGGTVAPFSSELYAVNWDTGQQSVHYPYELEAIGQARNRAEFQDAIMAEAVMVKRVVGPQGGERSFKIFLRNGDWVSHSFGLESRLKAAKIPIEVEKLERKKWKKPMTIDEIFRGFPKK